MCVVIALHESLTTVPEVCWFPDTQVKNLTIFSSGELALTNFDTQRLEEITSKGIRISSNQVTHPSTCENTAPSHLG